MGEIRKLNKIKTSGILNLIDVVLCLGIGVAFFMCLKLGLVASEQHFEGWDGVGFALLLVIFLPFVIIAYAPILAHAVYKIIYGILAIVNYKKVLNGKTLKLKKGAFTANTVLRIISIIMLAVEIFLVLLIFSAGRNLLGGLIFSAFIVMLVAVQILVMIIDKKAKNQRKEYVEIINE